MAKQFRACKKTKLNNSHELVNWVLKDRRKKEKDSQYTWYPYAARKEEKGSLTLNMGVEHQAMVIIRRDLTAEAKQKANELKKVAQAKRKAAQKQIADKKSAEIKAKEAAVKRIMQAKAKQNKAESEIAKKVEKIRKLEEENVRLKFQRKEAEQKLSTKEAQTASKAEKAASGVMKKVRFDTAEEGSNATAQQRETTQAAG